MNIIKLKYLLNEKYGDYSYGCIMACIDEASTRKILTFNYNIIPEDAIYREGDQYGREETPHVTLKYGLTKSYTQEQMKHLLRNVLPFSIQVKGIGVFENETFDVVKFDVDGKELRALNEMFSMLPNHDQHPEYNPHMTLAYLKKGSGRSFVKSPKRFARLPIKMVEYSDRGEKTYYRLGR
jgi:hypothetical protein